MKHPTGIQIYTLRNRLKEDLAETLSLIRQIGFDNVEYVKNCIALSAEELYKVVGQNGLSTCGVHVKSSDLIEEDSSVCSYAQTIKSPWITTSLMPPTDFDSWPEIVKYCQAAGKKAAAAGLLFTYHNHWYEPQIHNGSSILEKILEATDPNEVALELDIAWVAAAGRDPAEFIEKYGSRIAQIHFKDIKLAEFNLERPQSCLTFLGNGDVDLQACAEAARRYCSANVPFIYEQDIPDGDIVKNAADSFAVLRDLA